MNALAMRFIRMHMVVLLSDLLEACGDNAAARDMIIGHELGHIRAGHLRARWLRMPASFVPFLGSALSRARELTCDRYGCAAAGDRDGALTGLAILAAGPQYGPQVNIGALMRQRHDLRSAWMLIGEWLGSHPPRSKRIWALAPELEPAGITRGKVSFAGMRIVFAAIVVVVIGTGATAAYLPRLTTSRDSVASERHRPGTDALVVVDRDLRRLKAFIEDTRAGRPPTRRTRSRWIRSAAGTGTAISGTAIRTDCGVKGLTARIGPQMISSLTARGARSRIAVTSLVTNPIKHVSDGAVPDNAAVVIEREQGWTDPDRLFRVCGSHNDSVGVLVGAGESCRCRATRVLPLGIERILAGCGADRSPPGRR